MAGNLALNVGRMINILMGAVCLMEKVIFILGLFLWIII